MDAPTTLVHRTDMSRETKWLNPKWEPAPGWPVEDRLEVVSAFCELIQRDMDAQRYGLPGRPNFTSVQHVIREPPDVLEGARVSCLTLLRAARAERTR